MELCPNRPKMLTGLLAAALLATTRAAGGGRHTLHDKPQAQLRPVAAASKLAAAVAAPSAPKADTLLRQRLAASLGLFHVPGEIAAGNERKKEMKEEKEVEESGQPVTMQVPEGELKNLSSQLTPRCQTQFGDMLHGKSQFHTFGDSGAQKEGDCTKMKGGICAMNAELTQSSDAQGRSMKSTTHVSGDSCLPRDCMAESDLKILAEFMKHKAQSTLAGGDADIHLSVDCSQSGGSVANLGPPGASAGWHGRHFSAAPRAASVAAAAVAGMVGLAAVASTF